uniref:Uncharacterized protein n=1 Tax=Bigelowiella natans TaxID=227086 RepID=A0A6T7E901_BIGNA|mmetsp:Transcript_1135/g.1426  ORF Transcript_1135/g.1426 Transcript_1135/m.1426 type:complete len:158 (-) Transcript_1135:193-666(-)|eukprot:jgi/Bigna1/84826/estExt_fgenesh1_pg.C_10155
MPIPRNHSTQFRRETRVLVVVAVICTCCTSLGRNKANVEGSVQGFYAKFEGWKVESDRLTRQCEYWAGRHKATLRNLRKSMQAAEPYFKGAEIDITGKFKDPYVSTLDVELSRLYDEYMKAKDDWHAANKAWVLHEARMPVRKKLPWPRPYQKAMFD